MPECLTEPTCAQAELLLQSLLRGPEWSVNGNFTVVTDQLITLGLPDRIVNAIPLAGFRFDEATGEGPGTFFSGFLDFILDAAAFVAQGLALIGTTIAAFFEQAVAFLGELGMAVLGAIGAFLGQVAEAVQAVQESFTNFLNSFIDVLKDLVNSFLDATLRPLVESIPEYLSGILLAFGLDVEEFQNSGTVSTPTGQRMMNAILNPFFFAVLLIVTTLIVTVIALTTTVPVITLLLGLLPSLILIALLPLFGVSVGTPVSLVDVTGVALSSSASFDFTLSLLTTVAPVGLILNLMIPLVASLLLEARFGTAVEGTPFSFISEEVSMSAAVTGASLFISLESSLASLRDSLESILVLLGLVFGSVAIGINAFLTLARLDKFGAVAVGLAITVIALTLVMTAWINVNAGSQAERRGGLFGLAVGGIAWSVLGLLLGFLAVRRAKLSFKALAVLSFLLSFAALATSVSALLVVEALPNG